MTGEQQWLITTDAHRMLRLVSQASIATPQIHSDAVERRLQLFMVACCRRVQHLFVREWHRFALDVADEYSPETESAYRRDLIAMRPDRYRDEVHAESPELDGAVLRAVLPHELWEACEHLVIQVEALLHPRHHLQARKHNPLADVSNADLLREVFGNPFHPLAFDPSWRTSTAVALARQMYESRDFGAMPILADALEEAGCDEPSVLAHCRGDGPHVRGCWVVDLVLGKT